MKTRMWVKETDQYGATDRAFYINDPAYIPRVGEFVDGDGAAGWVSGVQWSMTKECFHDDKNSCKISTVYVYLKKQKL